MYVTYLLCNKQKTRRIHILPNKKGRARWVWNPPPHPPLIITINISLQYSRKQTLQSPFQLDWKICFLEFPTRPLAILLKKFTLLGSRGATRPKGPKQIEVHHLHTSFQQQPSQPHERRERIGFVTSFVCWQRHEVECSLANLRVMNHRGYTAWQHKCSRDDSKQWIIKPFLQMTPMGRLTDYHVHPSIRGWLAYQE